MTRRGALISVLVGYAVVTAPLAALFAWSDYFRFQAQQQLAFKLARLRRPAAAYLGDSITAAGRTWDDPTAINLGVDGYTIHQVAAALEKVEPLRPRAIYLMAGTNDILQGATDAQIESDVDALLTRAGNTGAAVTMTGVPLQKSPANDARVIALNERLATIAAKHRVRFIDLTPSIQRDRAAFFKDGYHFSPVGYVDWKRELQSGRFTDTQIALQARR